jgi:hypothetical protein
VPSYTLFSQPTAPASLVADNAAYTFGVEFSVSEAATLTAVWFFSASGAQDLPSEIALYAVSGATLVHSESASWSGVAASGWVSATFTSPPSLSASVNYKACVLYPGGGQWYSATSHYWDTGSGSGGITNGPLSAPDNAGGDGGQDTFTQSSSLSYPSSSFNATNYWVDPDVTVAAVSHQATASLAVTPSFHAAAARGRYHTAHFGISPVLAVTTAVSHHRAASLSVAPVLQAHAQRGHYRTATLAATPVTRAYGVASHAATASLAISPVTQANANVIVPGLSYLFRFNGARTAWLVQGARNQ